MAASVPWKVVHYDHASVALGEAYPENTEWGFFLNRMHSIQYDLDLTHPLATEVNTSAYGTDFILYRGTRQMMGGIHTAVNQNDVEDHALHVSGTDWKHAMEGAIWPFVPTNVLANVYTVTGRDLALIVKDFFTTINAQANRIQFDTTALVAVGSTLNYKIDVADTQNLYDKINDISGSSPGFDWDISWDKKVSLYYPQRGSVKAFVFDIGNNCKINNYTDNGIKGTHTLGLAQLSSGGKAGSVQDSTNQGTYRRWDTVEELNDVLSVTDLANRTIAAAARNSQPQLEFTVTYIPQNDEDILNQIWLGDTVTVRGDTGYRDLNLQLRIVGIEGRPTDTGDESIDFTFDFASLSL